MDKKKYVPAEKKTAAELKEILAATVEKWHRLYDEGGSDPSWPDGVNLNLVRNHIIYYNRLLADKQEPKANEQLSFFAEKEDYTEYPLPPEVDDDYMAQPERIRQAAKATLAALKADADVQFLLSLPPLDKAGEKALCLSVYQHNYFEGLIDAIQDDDLVAMRRKRDSEYWLKSFQEEAVKVRNYLGLTLQTA